MMCLSIVLIQEKEMAFQVTTKETVGNDVMFTWTDNVGNTYLTDDEEEATFNAVVNKYIIFRTHIEWQKVSPMLISE
jgi:hypothetical protein